MCEVQKAMGWAEKDGLGCGKKVFTELLQRLQTTKHFEELAFI